MKKIIIPILLMAVFASAGASTQTEKPEKIVSFVKINHDAQWYAHQAILWEKEVQKNPNNDDAWFYWFEATRYKLMFEEADDAVYDRTLIAIANRLHKERPNSYARYVIDHSCSHDLKKPMELDNIQDNMLKAISMRPDFEAMYPEYVVYLMKKGRIDLMRDVLKRWYNTGDYSYVLLSFAYNCLAGMEKNGILFVGGDVDTFSSLLVQYGKGLFQDRIIINLSLLRDSEYLENVCRRLGVEPNKAPKDQNNSDAVEKWEENLIFSIAHTTRRPVYFSSFIKPSYLNQFLYSEGLVVKYSSKRYDNLAVKRRNFESVYLTDYLYETFVPETYNASAYIVNLNFIPCFKSLLDFYKANGMKAEYDKLHNLMIHIVDNCKDNVYSIQRELNLKYYYDEIER
jgi:hypothetical protein